MKQRQFCIRYRSLDFRGVRTLGLDCPFAIDAGAAAGAFLIWSAFLELGEFEQRHLRAGVATLASMFGTDCDEPILVSESVMTRSKMPC